MLIDWYTVVAQLLNFLILVALLKYVLYGKIIRAMERREQTIKDRLAQAEESKREAEREAEVYRNKSRELNDSYDAQQARMKEEIESHRKELLAEARQEIAHLQSRWRQGLRQEQSAFMDELRSQAARRVFAIARRVLRDLADEDVERHMSTSFVSQLSGLDQSQWDQLRHPNAPMDAVTIVCSRFPMPAEVEQELRRLIREQCGPEGAIRFETDPDMICGVELRRSGRAIAWSVARYIEELEDSLAKVFRDELKEADAEASR